MNPQLLIEYWRLEPISIISESKETGTMKVKGIFGRAEEFNSNNRRYPKKILEREVQRLTPLINENRLLGQLDHPDSANVSLLNASHLITDLKWQGNVLMGEAQILRTPAGQVAQQLIKDGVKIGISSRGLGTLSECREFPGKFEVNEDFKAVTFDLVADPSTRGAHPGLSESIQFLTEKTKKESMAQKVLLKILENKLSTIKENKINKLFEGVRYGTSMEAEDKRAQSRFEKGLVTNKNIDKIAKNSKGPRHKKFQGKRGLEQDKKLTQKKLESTKLPKLKALFEGESTGGDAISTGIKVGKKLASYRNNPDKHHKKSVQAIKIGNRIEKRGNKKYPAIKGGYSDRKHYEGAQSASHRLELDRRSNSALKSFKQRLNKKFKS